MPTHNNDGPHTSFYPKEDKIDITMYDNNI